MEEKDKKEEIQSRRDFFKRTAKVLPVIALTGLGVFSSLNVRDASAACGCGGGCGTSCFQGCSAGCSSGKPCTGTCTGSCKGTSSGY